MIIKCNRREFNVNHTDKIVYNGSVYQLVTKRYRDGWYDVVPQVSKTLFHKLLKSGAIVLSDKKYVYKNETIGYISKPYDMYEFTEIADADNNGEN